MSLQRRSAGGTYVRLLDRVGEPGSRFGRSASDLIATRDQLAGKTVRSTRRWVCMGPSSLTTRRSVEGTSVVSRPGFASPCRHRSVNLLIAPVGLLRRDELTAHQREVLVALTLEETRAKALQGSCTPRGALYKTLHDARGKLRARLEPSPIRAGSPA